MSELLFEPHLPPQMETLLTGEDIARILQVSRSYAYILMRQGRIPTVHLGRAVRVRPADLERFIAENVSNTRQPGLNLS